MAGAGGRGVGHGWPGAGKDSGHPQHPHACRDETEKVEPGYAAAWGRRMRDNGHQIKYERYSLDIKKIFAIVRTVK